MRVIERMPNIRILLKEQEGYKLWHSLGKYELLRKITRSSLNPAILPNLRWAVIKNNKCVFVFNHQAAVVEFGKTKEAIKARLREEYKAHREQCKALGLIFDDIVCECLPNTLSAHSQGQEALAPQSQTKEPSPQPQPSNYYQRAYQRKHYKERSSGEFHIPQNCALKGQFMEIQKLIKLNLERERRENARANV